MNPSRARGGEILYPTEKVSCLRKFWSKACFHYETCKMTLHMKNYKGYEKKPRCNAHYPMESFTRATKLSAWGGCLSLVCFGPLPCGLVLGIKSF
uniref:Uncharacterized protein n=1 Tax=Phocoena sinus TaxID=42100 RepID=A0A8C9B1A8_PHOSS